MHVVAAPVRHHDGIEHVGFHPAKDCLATRRPERHGNADAGVASEVLRELPEPFGPAGGITTLVQPVDGKKNNWKVSPAPSPRACPRGRALRPPERPAPRARSAPRRGAV